MTVFSKVDSVTNVINFLTPRSADRIVGENNQFV